MEQFNDRFMGESRNLALLELLNRYDDFLDNIKVIADMGCGRGQDIQWWATLMDKDDPPKPRNLLCFAVDQNTNLMEKDIKALPNVSVINADFETALCVPRKIDLIWSFDSFQYAINPLQTLRNWNEMMSVNGMLVLTVPQAQSYHYNRLVTRTHNHTFYNYTATNLLYMLGVNGFDCNDCYVFKGENDPWLTMAVYKSNVAPMDPKTTKWDDIARAGLLNPSICKSYTSYGYVRQEDLIFKWLNGNWTFVKN